MREYDSSGTQTGIFKGKWRPSDCEGCGDSLYGKWTRPDGKGSLTFSLTVYAVDFRGPLKLVTRSITEKNRKPHPEYEITVEYPQIEGTGSASVAQFNELIRGEAIKTPNDYRTEFRTGYDGSEFHQSYDVGLANDDLISVDVIYYLYYGGAGERSAFSKTINYDLKRGRVIKFAELFRPGVDYMKWLTDYSVRDLKRQYRDEKEMTDERLREHVENLVGEEDKWLITPEGLVFVFDSMEFGPHGAGETRVIVLNSELRKIIRSDGPLSAFAR